MCSPNTHDNLVRDLVRESGCAIAFPYYTPGPEAQFPVQFEEAYATIAYIVANSSTLGVKADKTVFLGDSVGGHMTLAMSNLVAERGGPKVAYQVLFYPVSDLSRESDTYKSFENGPYLTRKTMLWMKDAFVPKGSDVQHYLLSPILMSKAQAARQPPSLIIVAGVDPLRGEGENFGHELQKAGVETAIFRADGQVHDFAMLEATRKSPTAVATVELAALKVRKALIGS
ncbi:Alpha/beta hydrolase fold-3 [Xylona heveae TC161]|uniref:Alpha/beta hydrolase fold-3 n=1 Tax=Xylona heveae (strain CBS 132557 / TC161) TaxID=1328760 RepID=A0A165J9X0_XYLHT|nr:Alpha/beta hydrolase fold-3 [Xylona heveae TC161]KZF25950.1 Alpha/beta hydrolase fold-3 [Xylona heveae TC161]